MFKAGWKALYSYTNGLVWDNRAEFAIDNTGRWMVPKECLYAMSDPAIQYDNNPIHAPLLEISNHDLAEIRRVIGILSVNLPEVTISTGESARKTFNAFSMDVWSD